MTENWKDKCLGCGAWFERGTTSRIRRFCSQKCYHKNYNTTHDVVGQMKTINAKIVEDVFKHYSNGNPKCARCGFSDVRALSIDHINGNGCEHRRKIRTTLARWLKQNNYPEGFQILCMNCQFIKMRENNEIGKGKLLALWNKGKKEVKA